MQKNTLIIGSSSKLSQALKKNLLKKKHNVYLTTSNAISTKKNYFYLDLNDKSSLKKFLSSNQKTFSKINNVIIVSAIIFGKNEKEYTYEEIKKIIDINFINSSVLIKSLLEQISIKIVPHIIFISSISAIRGSYDPYYASSKNAMHAFLKSIHQNRSREFRFNIICPSLILDTNMYKKMSKKNISKLKNKNPLKQIIKIDDFTKIIVDLMSDHWISLNLKQLVLDLGETR